MDHVERYLEVFDELRRRKRWSTGDTMLRFAALTLAANDVADRNADLEATAKILEKQAGAFSPLASAMRHAVAALLIRRGVDPSLTVSRIKETLAVFKRLKLSRSGPHPTLAALLLVLHNGGEPPDDMTVEKMKAILARWNKDHFFLTGVDDYPMAAMHATRELSVEEIGVQAEEIYQQLRKARFSSGEQLQLVSHLLMFSDVGGREAARRFAEVARLLRAAKQRVWQSHYDEVALLVLTGVHPAEVVPRVLEYRDRLRARKPRPAAEIAFSIAAGIVLAEEADKAAALAEAATAANLRAVQAVIEAQQAAAIACMAACTTVVTTSAASS
ncbi:MAG: DUF4003 family protein [Thermoanaerobaculales bacterium]|jgi:hypothetical protein|nr:DUF4003 family protein [Thermoanaerobaculales bacterium]